MTKSAKKGVATLKKATMVVVQNSQISKKKRKPKQKTSNYISKVIHEGNRAPRMRSEKGGTVVNHSETYGVNVIGSNAFSVFSNWAIQPGISTYSNGSPLGSWLPQIGTNFDNYEIQSLKFVYKSACSTLEPGVAVFGYEPNPSGSTPGDLTEIRNMMSAMGTVHNDIVFDVSNLVRKPLLTRKGAVTSYPNYDAGKVFFATSGCTDNAKLGFVEVHYVVRFFNPQSSMSTTAPNISYVPVQPTQRYAFTPSTDLGATNVASACLWHFGEMLLNGLGAQGAPLFTRVTVNAAAFTNVFSGSTFKQSANTALPVLQSTYGGRYRVRGQFTGDFQDLKLFALVPFKKSAADATFGLATTLVSDDINGASTTEFGCIPLCHRGFTGTATLDPDPATDLGLVYEFDIVLSKGDQLSVALGVRNYNSVSTTTANFAHKAGCGTSFVEIAFLGPSS